LPAALLERRPDVRQAEAQLMAANAQIGVAEAAMLPGLTINARAGATQILVGPGNDSTFAQVQGLLGQVLPFLGGAQLRHEAGAARADWRAAVATWQGAVLNALAEVADALSAVHSTTAVRQALEAQVAALRDAVALSRDRFVNGLANYLEVVEAQLQLLPAELNLARARAAELTAIVTLYRTLGGGWATEEPKKTAKAQ
jgi:multidrug efflux system outer membrane protein